MKKDIQLTPKSNLELRSEDQRLIMKIDELQQYQKNVRAEGNRSAVLGENMWSPESELIRKTMISAADCQRRKQLKKVSPFEL